VHLIRYAQSENEGWDIRRGKSFMNILVKFVVPIQIVAQVQTNPGERLLVEYAWKEDLAHHRRELSSYDSSLIRRW